MNNIKGLIQKHGKEKVRALIKLRPLNVYMGLIAVTSSSDPEVPILCEVDEKRYKVEEGYKIGWKPIEPFGPKPEMKMVSCNGFASETFYQGDFDSMVKDGQIKVYVEA
jgi:hypothetical protein